MSAVEPEAITSFMPLRDAGFAIPGPGRSAAHAGGRLLWSGRGQAMLAGPAPDSIPGVAMTDQTGAWAILRLEGAGAEAVLSRLTPLDLRGFADQGTARSLVGHMNALIHRDGAAWEVWVFRSMTGSAVQEVVHAMRSVDARSGA
jgi:heterotetrameric sarcosine oxidase gamma subunit